MFVTSQNVRKALTAEIFIKVYSDVGVIDKVYDLMDFVVKKEYDQIIKLTIEDFDLMY